MSVKYCVQEFGPRKDKWWFRIVHRRTVTLNEMAQYIEDASALTEIDVLSAVRSLALRLQVALARGDRVKIDGIGTFSLSARGLTDDSEAQLDTGQLDIVFLPDPQLRRYVCLHAEQKRETAPARASSHAIHRRRHQAQRCVHAQRHRQDPRPHAKVRPR